MRVISARARDFENFLPKDLVGELQVEGLAEEEVDVAHPFNRFSDCWCLAPFFHSF